MRLELWSSGFWAGAAVAALLAAMALPANAQVSGSFQSTCRSIQSSGGTLTAECRDPSGKYHSSSIAYTQCKGDIGNNNGTLFCNGATATSGPQNGGNGGRGNAAASADPAAGSFRATCRNVQTSGATLSAECADPSGRYHGSSIAFGQCRGDISNSNGMLSCNGATAVAAGARDFNNGRNDNFGGNGNNGRNDNFGNNGNGSRGGSDNGPGPGYGRNDNGPDYRGRPGPGFGGPPPPAQFAPGPYPQFDARERDIMQDIRDGQRYGRIDRREADNLMGQLQDIQDREERIYRAQGRYIRIDDSRRLDRDLDMLSQDVRRASRR